MTNNTRFKIQTYTKLLVHIEDLEEKERIIHLIEDLIEEVKPDKSSGDSEIKDYQDYIFEWLDYVKESNNFNEDQLIDYLTGDKEVVELWKEYQSYMKEKKYSRINFATANIFSRIVHDRFDLVSRRHRIKDRNGTYFRKVTFFKRRSYGNS